jgi:hypothetical protein
MKSQNILEICRESLTELLNKLFKEELSHHWGFWMESRVRELAKQEIGIARAEQEIALGQEVALTGDFPDGRNNLDEARLYKEREKKMTKMTKYRKKPVVIEAITFDELVAHGRAQTPQGEVGAPSHASNQLGEYCCDVAADGGVCCCDMPWSFDYKGHPITHEDDDCYLIPTLEGSMKFNRGDMLITGVQGEIYPCRMDIFEATYEPVLDPARCGPPKRRGQEAEELRAGVEKLIAEAASVEDLAVHVDDKVVVTTEQLQKLLDCVDARDSLHYLERDD